MNGERIIDAKTEVLFDADKVVKVGKRKFVKIIPA
jgi:hypothetical protein